jgi:hypothetical protein
MRRPILCGLALVALALPATTAAGNGNGKAKGKGSGNGTSCVLHAKLNAREAGTSSIAKGHTLIKVRRNGTIEYKTHILNKGHETVAAGHIHQAPAGSNGPIVFPIFRGMSPTNARQIKDRGSVPAATPADAQFASQLCQNPSAYYVNYHTTANPAGAIRGQLH